MQLQKHFYHSQRTRIMNAPLGCYLRIKLKDNMLIFLFAKAASNYLTQNIYSCIKIFLWVTFTLYLIKYAILDQFWGFFSKCYPLDNQEYFKPVANFKWWWNTPYWIVCWFFGLFILRTLQKVALKFGAFLPRRSPWKPIFEKNAKLFKFHLMIVCL